MHYWNILVAQLATMLSPRCAVMCCLSLVWTSGGEAIFTSWSLSTKYTCELHLQHASDLELQYEQASALLPFIKWNYSNIMCTLWIFLIFELFANSPWPHSFCMWLIKAKIFCFAFLIQKWISGIYKQLCLHFSSYNECVLGFIV
jgi:hypothetical protein